MGIMKPGNPGRDGYVVYDRLLAEYLRGGASPR